jgi:hypothetical protein
MEKQKSSNLNLFTELEPKESDWKNEWKDMPEFIQLDKEPCQKIVVNFEDYQDVLDFAKLLGFKVTNKTKSIWFPIRDKDKPRNYAYVDNNE